MVDANEIKLWPERVRKRYENYLKTSFFFKERKLRVSFENALQNEGSLLKGPYAEVARDFVTGIKAQDLAQECFPQHSSDLLAALLDHSLYVHQEQAIRAVHMDEQNIVVATGTASGKTESFLYPILFELYRQYLADELKEPGVRAMILYPMNALANDQRKRLGEICQELHKAGSGFEPTFGQYIGQTPESIKDRWRNATVREEERLRGELIFRDEMRGSPPHILLTNYSMLEYLLIRPDDSPLFDKGMGTQWKFIVLDEAHQYRGAKGMEMGMLIRRLKQRLRAGGRQNQFRCIATSATISSGETKDDKLLVAEFVRELFGEPFTDTGIIFGESQKKAVDRSPNRYHAFLRALEGAFLVYREGADAVVLNRKGEGKNGGQAEPLEIALCRECGQHYYVGKERGGKLKEAVRDPSQPNFGVDFYIPGEDGDEVLCRQCGALSKTMPTCECGAEIRVKRCKSHPEHADQLKQCETCGYQRGGIGDPVREIVHGSDGPSTVIATALHELLPEDSRKVLAFTDSRQEAAFFAWYAEDSYEKLRDRNFLLRAVNMQPVAEEGLSIDDLRNRLLWQWEQAGLFSKSDTKEQKSRQVLASILREALTDERRLSLSGVGLVQWLICIPDDLNLPDGMQQPPWRLTKDESCQLIQYLLNELRRRRAMNLPEGAGTPVWSDVSPWPQQAYGIGAPGSRRNVSQWGAPQSTVVSHFLHRLLSDCALSKDQKKSESMKLMETVWHALRNYGDDSILLPGTDNGTYRLNPSWLRIKIACHHDIWECDTCATLTTYNVRNICPRSRCPGILFRVNQEHLKENHYRILYESADLPPSLKAEEHTAQIDSDEARMRQDKFKNGDIHLLSSSTTFEVGVDLGNLETVFLRNVPPESFNYTQRVGRAGRRETPGLALTYCRRNPHDLYHYEDPLNRVINGAVHPPRLKMTNEKIILRHMVATALSAFFRGNSVRFKNVENFVGDWTTPHAAADFKSFCQGKDNLLDSLREIIPKSMRNRVGLEDDSWIEKIVGEGSRFASVEAEVCADYCEMKLLRKKYFDEGKDNWVGRIGKRMKTIEEESTLNLLSRKAVIPKYGFPVDVVELDTRSQDRKPYGVALQRDLSQAIAEYAPGGKVVANKLEWESCGIKTVTGKAWPVRHYQYDDARNFTLWKEGAQSPPSSARKYIIPEFGFVTPLFKKPMQPRGRTQRLYTTRPFFQGFGEDSNPKVKTILGIQVTKSLPGTLVILCEGKNREGFYICRSCGAHMTRPHARHNSPSNSKCRGTLEQFSLGHELVTDVIRLQFPRLSGEWEAYSVAYAILLGAAEALNVPDTDLNVTITGGVVPGESAIVLYDNVPGGAGLVAQLEQKDTFRKVLSNAQERVRGNCGCDLSCYGCLRSYRNQFAHPHLDRIQALDVLMASAEPSAI
ncbi:MAG: DEAD/DEAH box helicase [Gammaproteobacteria bacterium]|nr:DEAD/DEAH box helicase [Gammaproteobacteria bacterium]